MNKYDELAMLAIDQMHEGKMTPFEAERNINEMKSVMTPEIYEEVSGEIKDFCEAQMRKIWLEKEENENKIAEQCNEYMHQVIGIKALPKVNYPTWAQVDGGKWEKVRIDVGKESSYGVKIDNFLDFKWDYDYLKTRAVGNSTQPSVASKMRQSGSSRSAFVASKTDWTPVNFGLSILREPMAYRRYMDALEKAAEYFLGRDYEGSAVQNPCNEVYFDRYKKEDDK